MSFEVKLPDTYQQMMSQQFGDIWETFYEIGVHIYPRCRLKKEIDHGKNVVLFEPKPTAAEDIRKNIEGKSNVTFHEVALANFNGTQNLYVDDEASAYLEAVKEPNDRTINHSKVIKVEVKKISEFDEGNIDVLMMDAEGSEALILETLKSRPRCIIAEVDKTGYTKDKGADIYAWMGTNGYIFLEKCGSDALFVRRQG